MALDYQSRDITFTYNLVLSVLHISEGNETSTCVAWGLAVKLTYPFVMALQPTF